MAALVLTQAEGYVHLFVDEDPPVVELLRQAQERGRAPAYVALLLAACSATVAGDAE